MQILGSPDPLRSTACRTHITPGHGPTNRQCRDPAPTGDAAGTDKGVSGQRPTTGPFRGHQWAGTVATSGQFRCDTAGFHGRRHPLLPSRSRNFTGTIEPKGEA